MAGLESSAGTFTNLKIQVSNDLQTEDGELVDNPGETRMEEDELEEGEASEDDVEMNVIPAEGDAEAEGRNAKEIEKSIWQEKKKHENKKGGGSVSGAYEVRNKVLSERARRFGVTDPPKSAPTPEAIAKLYKSLDVTEGDFTRGHYRADALYVRGTQDLSTKDVLEYFQAYAASSVEWINDNSCNVIWPDAVGPVRALIKLSCPILPREADLKKSRHTSRRRSSKKIQDGASNDNYDEGRPKIKIKKEKKDKSRKKKNPKDGNSSSSSSSGSSSESDGESSSSDSSSSSKMSGSSIDSSNSHSPENGTKAIQEKVKKKKKKKSVKVKVEKMDEDRVSTKTVDDEDSVRIEDVAVPVPPGRWRLGVPCPRTKAVLLRFSGRKDKKLDGAEKKSEYYRKYGNPNFGGIRGLLSESGRRRMREARRRREQEEGPMYGREERDMDDGSKNPWGALAQNWGRKESQEEDRFDYQALLRQHQKHGPGKKRKRGESDYEDEDTPEDENNHYRNYEEHGGSRNRESEDSDDVVPWKSKIKSPRMKMYADDEQKKRKRKKSGDLWNRLSGRKEKSGRVQDRLTEMPAPKSRDIRSRLDLRSKLSSRRNAGPVAVEVDSDHYYKMIASDDE